jgi:glycosyltransferase involved in cell wall biosynthesis
MSELRNQNIYVLQSTDIAGGVKVVLEQANRLNDIGKKTAVFSLIGKHSNWYHKDLKISNFKDYDELKDKLSSIKANKIATFWATAPVVAESAFENEGFYLVQDIESIFYEDEMRRQLVMDTYRLPLTKITNSKWVLKQLQQLGFSCTYIGMAIDNTIYNLKAHVNRKPYLVLVNAPRTRNLWQLKGMDTLSKALELAKQIVPQMAVCSFSAELWPLELPTVRIRHYSRPTDEEIALLYNSASCFVSASEHEGFGLPLLEAMACGCPVVCTRADGNEEFCISDKTCVLVNKRDVNALAKAIVQVISGQDLSHHLSMGGLKMSKQYNWDTTLMSLKSILV